MTIEHCFQTAARIQILLRDLHSGLARCFGTNHVLRETFLGLAREEHERVLGIRLLVLDRSGIPWPEEAIDTLRADLVATIAELSAMAGELQASPEGSSAGSILRRVIEAERRCGAIHVRSMARSADPELRGFFASLASRDLRLERMLDQALQCDAAPVELVPAPAGQGASHLAA